jgi:hypothetical protein
MASLAPALPQSGPSISLKICSIGRPPLELGVNRRLLGARVARFVAFPTCPMPMEYTRASPASYVNVGEQLAT